MEAAKLSLSALKDKVASKLTQAAEPSGKNNQKGKSKPGKSDSKAKDQKQNDKKQKSKDKNDKKEESKQKEISQQSKQESEQDVLRREALALGATEEDLKLLEGVDDSGSEAEFEDAQTDQKLNDDLADFMNGLGFSGKVEIASEGEAEGTSEGEAEDVADDVDDEADVDDEDDEADVNEAAEDDEDESEGQSEGQSEGEPSDEPSDEKSSVVVGELNKKAKVSTEKDHVDDLRSVRSTKLLVPTDVEWFNVERINGDGEKLDRFALERLTERAKDIMEKDNKLYLQEFAAETSQRKFLTQILSDGTLNDKISALTLLVQEAPFHNVKALDTILGYCEKKSRTASLQAIDALKDLFLNQLLPERKLVSFGKQQLLRNMPDRDLALGYFEEYLKKSYFRFIQVLEHLSHDPILHVRMSVVGHIFDLLKGKPEQEANLLRLGVNKLGDVDNKVASKTSYLILQLEQAHPAMKRIVTGAVTDLVLQKATEHHSQYYAILTLNQTILSAKEPELANALVKTYFSLFEKVLVESDPATTDAPEDKAMGKVETGRKNNRKTEKKGKKGGKSVKVVEKSAAEVAEEKAAKLFTALLTGLNRAFPFADLPADIYIAHLDTLFRITHSTNFNTAIQALTLIQHIVQEQDLDPSRYYRTLYESLLDPRLVNSSKQGVYLNLLFKSLKNDISNVPRVLAFVKRILQVCVHWLNIGGITGLFFLLMELSKTHPQVLELMEAKEARPDDDDGSQNSGIYDPRKRNPEFSNADNSCLWEINNFLSHYHPTVAVYADAFMNGQPQPKPDLGLYTLAHFLDRFVYKNAKKNVNTRGTSIHQPLVGGDSGSKLVRATGAATTGIPANTVDWLSKKASEVRPDERFFHQYFSGNSDKIRNREAQKKKAANDDGEEDGEMDDDEVWNALVLLKPEVEGDDDDDEGFSDMDPADFSDDDDEDEAAGEIDGDLPDFDEDVDFDPEAPEFDEAEFETAQGSDDDGPDMFGVNDEDEVSDAEFGGFEEEGQKPKRAATGNDEKKNKKRKLLNLPMFALAEDYAQYLSDDD